MSLLQNLSSYKECKLNLHHSPVELSRLGFRYNPATALVQCSECAFDITESDKPTEIIIQEHAKWGPKCPFHSVKNSNKNTEYNDSYSRLFDSTKTAHIETHIEDQPQCQEENICEEDQVDQGFCSAPSKTLVSDDISNSISIPTKYPPSSENVLNSDTGKKEKIPCEYDSPSLEKTRNNIKVIVQKSNDILNGDESYGKIANTFMDNPSNAEPAVKSQEIDATYLIRFCKHPIMASTEERRESFKGQEQKYKHCERATIEDFVEAGLFYVGPEDNVRCFFCDGGLRNVQSHNHPFLEHKRWFPNCKYLIFVEDQKEKRITDRQTTKQLQKDDPSASATSAFDTMHVSLKIPGRAMEAREVKARLETSVVQELMRQGFQREYLKRAIERRFILHNDDFSSAHELVQDILDIEGVKALPRPGQPTSSNQATGATAQNSDAVDGAAAAAVVRTAVSCTGRKLLGKGKDLLAAEAEFPVSDEVKNMKTADVLQTLKNTPIVDSELKRLWDEYQEQSQVRTCKICLDREINTVFLPCGHYVTCDKCCPKISHCCICRALIRGTVLALSATSEIK